jgi:hypothetical protein
MLYTLDIASYLQIKNCREIGISTLIVLNRMGREYMAETQDIRLAFMDVLLFSDGSIRGGILTTDIETRPYEFRITSAIKPTQLQQMLYGTSLKDYVYGELICAPLIKATKEKISFVLAKERYIMDVRPLVAVPIVLVLYNDRYAGDGVKPITFQAHKNFSSELSYVQTVLTPIMQRHDLTEPFERLKLALNEVHRMGVGEKSKGG